MLLLWHQAGGRRIEQVVGGGEREAAAAPSHERGGLEGPLGPPRGRVCSHEGGYRWDGFKK